MPRITLSKSNKSNQALFCCCRSRLYHPAVSSGSSFYYQSVESFLDDLTHPSTASHTRFYSRDHPWDNCLCELTCCWHCDMQSSFPSHCEHNSPSTNPLHASLDRIRSPAVSYLYHHPGTQRKTSWWVVLVSVVLTLTELVFFAAKIKECRQLFQTGMHAPVPSFLLSLVLFGSSSVQLCSIARLES